MKLIRIKEAAERYGISPVTLYAWRYQRKFPGLYATLGRCLYIDEHELRRIARASKAEYRRQLSTAV